MSPALSLLLFVNAALAVDPALIVRVKAALPEPGGATTLLYAADPWLVSLLSTGGGAARDMRGESPVVDLIDTSLTLSGTLLTGRTCGQGVVMREVVLHLDTGGGPSPDLRLTISLTGVRAAPMLGWNFGVESPMLGQVRLAWSDTQGKETVGAADCLEYSVDLGPTGRVVADHPGSGAALVPSPERSVWDYGPVGPYGNGPEHALMVLHQLSRHPEAHAHPNLAVALSLTFGALRGLVAPELQATVEQDALERLRYATETDAWLEERGRSWRITGLDPVATLLWAWPAGEAGVYGALPLAWSIELLNLSRYRHHVPDVATLRRLREWLPIGLTVEETARTWDNFVWDSLRYRANQSGMEAMCRQGTLSDNACRAWLREQGGVVSVVDGVAVAAEHASSVTLQLQAFDQGGAFVGDCTAATTLVMAAGQALGLAPLAMGYAGADWSLPTHNLPFFLDGDVWRSPQDPPAPSWDRSWTYAYAVLPMIHPSLGLPLGWEPGGWARGGSLAGGWLTYGELSNWYVSGIRHSTVAAWIEAQARGEWPWIP